MVKNFLWHKEVKNNFGNGLNKEKIMKILVNMLKNSKSHKSTLKNLLKKVKN
jgi:hypothetical protein